MTVYIRNRKSGVHANALHLIGPWGKRTLCKTGAQPAFKRTATQETSLSNAMVAAEFEVP
eukprot:jgi/Hompol1/2170/HPOL_004995-RA